MDAAPGEARGDVIPMYDELIEQLRETSIDFGESDDVSVMMIEAADAIEDLITALTASNEVIAKSKPKWIPVTERLPCLTTPVLATDGIEVDIAWMYGVPPRWITSFTAIDEDKLTHWMPLPKTPQPPKESES